MLSREFIFLRVTSLLFKTFSIFILSACYFCDLSFAVGDRSHEEIKLSSQGKVEILIECAELLTAQINRGELDLARAEAHFYGPPVLLDLTRVDVGQLAGLSQRVDIPSVLKRFFSVYKTDLDRLIVQSTIHGMRADRLDQHDAIFHSIHFLPRDPGYFLLLQDWSGEWRLFSVDFDRDSRSRGQVLAKHRKRLGALLGSSIAPKAVQLSSEGDFAAMTIPGGIDGLSQDTRKLFHLLSGRNTQERVEIERLAAAQLDQERLEKARLRTLAEEEKKRNEQRRIAIEQEQERQRKLREEAERRQQEAERRQQEAERRQQEAERRRQEEERRRQEEERNRYPSLVKLRSMPGMGQIAAELSEIRDFLQTAAERGAKGMGPGRPPVLHVRFEGNPGTGKTVVARLYGELLRALGALPGQVPKDKNKKDKNNENNNGGQDGRQGFSLQSPPLDPMEQFEDLWSFIESKGPRIDEGVARQIFIALMSLTGTNDFSKWVKGRTSGELTQAETQSVVKQLRRMGRAGASLYDALSYSDFEDQGPPVRVIRQVTELFIGAQRRLSAEDNNSSSNSFNDTTKNSTKAPNGAPEIERIVPVIEVSGSDFVGYDAAEKMKKAIKRAMGGVLIIDELYAADVRNNSKAREAAAVLLKEMEDKRGQFVVIVTGYPREMQEFIASNPGFEDRFARRILFEDYDDATLLQILNQMVAESGYRVEERVARSVIQKIGRRRGPGFGNARAVRKVFEAATKRHAVRLQANKGGAERADLTTLTLEDFQFQPPANEGQLAALDKMVGLDEVKESLRSIVALLQLEQARADSGLPSERPLLNAIFAGNPGTGKTTVGKTYASILKSLGYLSDGEVIVVKAGDLIGDVVGASETKTREMLKRASGKVLFIDEAYLLYRPDGGGGGTNSFGRAVLDTLVSEINPDANQDMVIILAGYSKEMQAMLTANPGLARRFPRTFNFRDYNAAQLGQILLKKAGEKGFTLAGGAQQRAIKLLGLQALGRDFGNAGAVENLLGIAQLRQANRLRALRKTPFTKEELQTLLPEDILDKPIEPDEVLQALQVMPGLKEVKEALHDIKTNLEEAELVAGSTLGALGHHYLFTGHSFQDQEMVANVLGKLLRALYVLPSEELVVVSPGDLIGEFTGQSTAKTRRAMESALGRTIVINNIGALADMRNPFQKEAVDTLLGFLNEHHGKMAVVFSGTESEAGRFFSNVSAARSLIDREIVFRDLNLSEGLPHFVRLLKDASKRLTERAMNRLTVVLDELLAAPGWGNSRNIERFTKQVMIKQAVRCKRNVHADPSDVTEDDIDAVVGAKQAFGYGAASPLQGPQVLDVISPQVVTHGPGPVQARQAGSIRPAAVQKIITVEPVEAETHRGQNHKHNHDHDHNPVEFRVSDETRRIVEAMELLGKNKTIPTEELQAAIETGRVSEALARSIAQQLGLPLDAETLKACMRNIEKAIRQMKREAKRLKELAKTNENARRLIMNYICLACGRTTCNFMPFTWFTTADD